MRNPVSTEKEMNPKLAKEEEALYSDLRYARRIQRLVSHCPVQWNYWKERVEIAEYEYWQYMEQSRLRS